MLTIKELASLLNVSKQTVHRLMRDGEIKSIKVRGATRFEETEVASYILKQQR